MANNRRITKTIPEYFRRETSVVRLDTGPYIGKVKNNLDPTRSGRLQVYIPDLSSGDEDDSNNWRTVAYASPFIGATTQPDSNKQNAFDRVRHTYGFWAVPPDIGNLVLCLFVAGDPNRGFWFACIPPTLGHHMIPGIAGSNNVDTTQIKDSDVKSGCKSGSPTIVAEFNENDESKDWSNFNGIKKPVHEEQFKVLLNQGLHEDFIRGIISSSSQRESPSAVFGISTPGRPINDTNDQYVNKVVTGKLKESDYAVAARRGGHSFVMDDGNYLDKDRLVRLRTSGGHQILMNDSERILYIGNSDGSVWIELTGPGHLNIYTGNSVNIRAEGELNFHADENINLCAENNINISAGKKLQVQSESGSWSAGTNLTFVGGSGLCLSSDGTLTADSSGAMNLTSGATTSLCGSSIKLNESGRETVAKPAPLTFNKLSDTGKVNNIWTSVDNALSTIVSIAPTHEPWKLHQGTKFVNVVPTSTAKTPEPQTTPNITEANEIPVQPSDGIMTGPAPEKDAPVIECAAKSINLDPGPQLAQKAGVKNPVNKSYLFRKDNPPISDQVGPLTGDQVKSLITQLGWNESGFRYTATNPFNYLGKYQTGAAVLTDQQYIKKDAYQLYGNKAVNIPTSWTGKDGITSREEYLANHAVQEKVMLSLLKSNYTTLKRINGIKPTDDLCTVSGMLAAAHLIGAGGAKKWRETGGGQDAYGTTGTTYFNMGRYAVDVLSMSMATPNTRPG